MEEYASPPAGAVPSTSGLAVASLILSICAVAMCLGPVTGIPGIICGHMALARIRDSGGMVTGRGMALAGLVLGYLSLLMVVFFVILMAGVTLPAFVRARDTAREVATLNAVRQIGMACMVAAEESNGRLPSSLDELVSAGHVQRDLLESPRSKDEAVDFELVLSGSIRDVVSPQSTLMVREIPDEGQERIAVGFADGHVEMLPAYEVGLE